MPWRRSPRQRNANVEFYCAILLQSMKLSHLIASAVIVSQMPDSPGFVNCVATIGVVCVARERVLIEGRRLFQNLTLDDLLE